jgi:hypothetical protein
MIGKKKQRRNHVFLSVHFVARQKIRAASAGDFIVVMRLLELVPSGVAILSYPPESLTSRRPILVAGIGVGVFLL